MISPALLKQRRKILEEQLPSEYQQVEWIKAEPASALIQFNTEYYPNHLTRITTRFKMTVSTTYSAPYGTEKPRFSMLKNRCDWNTAEKFTIPALALGTVYDVDHNRNYVTINGTQYGPIAKYEEFNCTLPLAIQTLNGYLQNTTQFKGETYFFKIQEDDVLVRDFVPCYRKSDNCIGFYCRVTKKFYAPNGQSGMSKGADV